MAKVIPLHRESPKTADKRPVTKLSKRVVCTIQRARGRDVWRWDAELRGFGVRVRPSGVRTYVVQYRDAGGRTRRLALGRHGVLTCEEARLLAKQRLGAVAKGENPSVERKQARLKAKQERSVAAVAKDFLTEIAKRRKPLTASTYERLFDARILPRFGKLPAREITAEDVRDWHTSLKKTPIDANRALAVLSSMFSFSRLPNPCLRKAVERFPERPRTRFLSEEELRKLGGALVQADYTRTVLPQVTLCIRLLLLTGMRISEALSLRWSDIDFHRGVLLLRDAKAGARAVPMGVDAAALLAALPQTSPEDYVIPGSKPGQPFKLQSVEGFWRRFRKRVGFEDVNLHDLRHTVGTFAGAAGLNAFAVRDLLGHKTLAMTGRYVSADTNPLRRAADAAVGPIARALAGKATAGET